MMAKTFYRLQIQCPAAFQHDMVMMPTHFYNLLLVVFLSVSAKIVSNKCLFHLLSFVFNLISAMFYCRIQYRF